MNDPTAASRTDALNFLLWFFRQTRTLTSEREMAVVLAGEHNITALDLLDIAARRARNV